MNDKVDLTNYVFVIVEAPETEEATFVGLTDADGTQFVPVTAEKDQAAMLLGRLAAQGSAPKRQVEAIHRGQIVPEAKERGFEVYLVDGDGKILERGLGL